MALTMEMIRLIGRHIPAIFDVIPRGPQLHRRFATELNPQPIPPHDGGFVTGMAMAKEWLNMAWMADRFGLKDRFLDDDELCPRIPRFPRLPPWWPWPLPPDPRPEWMEGYRLGFAVGLAQAADGLKDSALAPRVEKMIDHAIQGIQHRESAAK